MGRNQVNRRRTTARELGQGNAGWDRTRGLCASNRSLGGTSTRVYSGGKTGKGGGRREKPSRGESRGEMREATPFLPKTAGIEKEVCYVSEKKKEVKTLLLICFRERGGAKEGDAGMAVKGGRPELKEWLINRGSKGRVSKGYAISFKGEGTLSRQHLQEGVKRGEVQKEG